MLTLKRYQFLGMITREYLDQMVPVAARAVDWEADSFSAGRARSPRPAITSPHLKDGAQKKTVFGPAGWFQNGWNLAGTILSALLINARYIAAMVVCSEGWKRWRGSNRSNAHNHPSVKATPPRSKPD